MEGNEKSVQIPSAADQLAREHRESGRHPRHALPSIRTRLRVLNGRIEGIYADLRKRGWSGRPPGSEWLLDNEYLIRDVLRQLGEGLPCSFWRELPRVGEGRLVRPRALQVARKMIDLSWGQLEIEWITRFLQSYQEVLPLSMGELWALPALLRLGVLEDLADAAEARITVPAGAPATLSAPSPGKDHEGEGAGAPIAENVLSLRTLQVQDWKEFFEQLSHTERTLRCDPSGFYPRMDFATRDRYRKEVERFARTAGRNELDIAEATVRLAGEARGTSERQQHVGHYLIGKGQAELEDAVGCRPSPRVRIGRFGERHAVGTYLAVVGVVTGALLFLGSLFLDLRTGWEVAVALALAAIPVSGVALALVNWLVSLFRPPRILPKLDLGDGLPADRRTVVAVPALITCEEEIASLLAQLETTWLADPHPGFTIVLLSDLADAPREAMDGDDALLAQAITGIRSLNERHGHEGWAPFRLIHRVRRWNPAEGMWMAWERKRGKLEQFLRLLRGRREEDFTVLEGGIEDLESTRYVITMDADTLLVRGVARRLVGAMAHPLNRPEFDGSGRVTSGYTVMQPRVETQPFGVDPTRFSRIFSGDSTIDVYTHAVSEVYQDLFAEGIYAGKGILDVDAFSRSLEGRVPENALLSHDLFEGIHGRTALVDDVYVLERFPTHYLTWVKRLHRWVRGDWQLLPWLRRRVPTRGDARLRNRLSLLDRVKIADNLRRSLVPPCLLLLLVVGWLLHWTGAFEWFLLVGTFGAVPFLLGGLASVGHLLRARLRGRSTVTVPPLTTDWARWALALVFLPQETAVVLDAVFRVLYRLAISRRHLLQWVTAAEEERALGRAPRRLAYLRAFAPGPAAAVLVFGLLAVFAPAALPGAAVLLIAWLLSPAVAAWINRPLPTPRRVPQPEDVDFLRRLARRTHLFFEQALGPDDHWLPPDHFQEEPRGVFAHRTSPTNIGMALLSTLSAYDLGYISPLGVSLRLSAAFQTLRRLERYRGHFLNWYDTLELTPLEPRYVSTVDSGNLAGCLLAVKQGFLDIDRGPVTGPRPREGLLDTASVLEEAIAGLSSGPYQERALSLAACAREISQRIRETTEDLPTWRRLLDELHSEGLTELDRRALEFLEADPGHLGEEPLEELRIWLERLHHGVEMHRRQLTTFAPWLSQMKAAPASFPVDRASPVRDAWREIEDHTAADLAVEDVETRATAIEEALSRFEQALDHRPGPAAPTPEEKAWCRLLRDGCGTARQSGRALRGELDVLSLVADEFVRAMDFTFLYDGERHLFRIGHDISRGEPDPNHYDLLASEARLASLVAIAKGDAPPTHWSHLGRPYAKVDHTRVLLSWGGSMFEYLMPLLLTRNPDRSLLSESCRAAVRRQIRYARRQSMPWGVSEAGFFQFDAQQNYQYRSFGVPGLGLKRDLERDRVVSPYASVLALAVTPGEAAVNLAALTQSGLLGRFGFFEALDLRQSVRVDRPRGAIVRSYMAHHQGMILTALANHLLGDLLVERFHANHVIRTVEHLLCEQIPTWAPLEVLTAAREVPAEPAIGRKPVVSFPVPVESPTPRWQLLGNGRYSVLLSNAGSGTSRFRGIFLTTWREDATCEGSGTWIYVKDLDGGDLWSACHEPTQRERRDASSLFGPHRVEFGGRHGDIAERLEITVSPDQDAEIRRLTLTNDSDRTRRLFVSSCAEVVLAPHDEYRRHPAFSKLFVECSFRSEDQALLFSRRPRSPEDHPLYLGHTLRVNGAPVARPAVETCRSRWIGRGGSHRRPAALAGPTPVYGGAETSPLDPLMALGSAVTLPPRGRATVLFVTAAAESQSRLLSTLDRCAGTRHAEWTFERARDQAERLLDWLEIDPATLEPLQDLFSALVTPLPCLRPPAATLAANVLGQPHLWSFGISGDRPILLVHAERGQVTPLLLTLVRAFAYWRSRGFVVDLVILDHRSGGYTNPFRDRLLAEVQRCLPQFATTPGEGLFVLRADALSAEVGILLESTARAVLQADGPSLRRQLAPMRERPAARAPFVPVPSAPLLDEPTPDLPRPHDLLFDNGLGGFGADGREYVIHLEPGRHTPAPWTNVVANPGFGFLISESGGGYTWALNSGERRLTPWRNDPVEDRPGEVLYLRDEETGTVWTPTPAPAPDDRAYQVRHGAGYTTFLHHSQGLSQELTLFAARRDPVKLIRLRLTNFFQRTRRLTATYYVEWVLGTDREVTGPSLIPGFDARSGVLTVRNPRRPEGAGRTAFLSADRDVHAVWADRAEFLGRRCDLSRPAGLVTVGSSGRVEPGGDPCGALQIHLELEPGETIECHFVLGEGADHDEALALARRYVGADAVDAAFEEVRGFWEDLLGKVSVRTPDRAMDLLLNRWLPYQACACRIWGRSALYQSSGAFGFRDQLQDVLAFLSTMPELAREQILAAAAHQFLEGDVLHWWHPPGGQGVRTRCSDDLLWLPYVTALYVQATGDRAVLDVEVPWLAAPPLEPEETERYGTYEPTSIRAPLYDHCIRAIDRASRYGPHGLPLIGTGDWNDGLNRVGREGRGESVWLGWFLCATLEGFAPLAEARGDEERARALRETALDLARVIEDEAWDGAWYRRAYFDDGTPLGSKESPACCIDAIAQAWAVLSGAGDPARIRRAMAAVDEHLIRDEERLVLLLAPPFDLEPWDPGYIRGYPPGIRENGGQYTHAAVWVGLAFAVLGDGDRAEEIFRLLNPIYRTTEEEEIRRYAAEPYVYAADIAGMAPHTGHCGWTWYTGSAAWGYRFGVEGILGVRIEEGRLILDPCIPRAWNGYEIRLRAGRSVYRIEVQNPHGATRGVVRLEVDGTPCDETTVDLVDDGRDHHVKAWMGRTPDGFVPEDRGHRDPTRGSPRVNGGRPRTS